LYAFRYPVAPFFLFRPYLAGLFAPPNAGSVWRLKIAALFGGIMPLFSFHRYPAVPYPKPSRYALKAFLLFELLCLGSFLAFPWFYDLLFCFFCFFCFFHFIQCL
jgi:hypothetical protein